MIWDDQPVLLGKARDNSEERHLPVDHIEDALDMRGELRLLDETAVDGHPLAHRFEVR